MHGALNDLKSGSDRAPKPSRYIRYEFRAQTLDALRTWAKRDGAAAVEEARLSALTIWMMWRSDNPPGSISAVAQHRTYMRKRLGFPSFHPWREKPAWTTPGIAAVTNQVLEAWEAAGSPHLLKTIEQTQQHIHSARLAAEERRVASEALDPIFGDTHARQ